MLQTDIYFILRIPVSLLPVFVFLISLVIFDSYKLLKFRSLNIAIVFGFISAGASYFLNTELMSVWDVDLDIYSRYAAPFFEELFKAACVFYFIKTKKTGFMVDSAIVGFAAGAGFASVENIYYLTTVQDTNLFIWIIRGFGTAVMHGGTTAIYAVITKFAVDRYKREKLHLFLPGLGISYSIHSIFNHFFLPPLISTLVLLIVFPLLLINIFWYSEKLTKSWLGVGFDTDMELLKAIKSGKLSETKVGIYLKSLKQSFPGEVVVDMLCMLRLHLEFAMSAKGILLAKEAGLPVTPAPGIKEKFEELRYLEKSIGKTGMLAVSPILHTSSRDLWQLHMLNQ